ncbi:MAG: RecQ family ATP-dependent DNA helicase [Balneolales bacterium]
MDDLMARTLTNLKKYWGYTEFRPGQEEVVRSVLESRETVVLFPTGGGKSLCYQLPATVLDGLTVVISPLVALMQDQVSQLTKAGISAAFINSTLPAYEVEQRLVNARNGMYRILYCAPERLKTQMWQNNLDDLPIRLIAIDEAHCISEWGHDFRPSYRQIKAAFLPVADKVRWMALTATATPEVRDDIIQCLEFKDPHIISRGFERPNLKWWVIREERKERRLNQIMQKARGSGLVYAGTRKTCENLAQNLRSVNINARAYHAGLTGDLRKTIQEGWINGEIAVVVATNAFGMGIDKSDCRYVVHYDMPYSLEAYYQEAGRAGRDGRESYPILLARPSDHEAAKKNIKQTYPDRDELKLIYDAICDDWNLAAGSQMEEPAKIIIEHLQKRNKLSKRMQYAGIRVLEQLGVLAVHTHKKSQTGLKLLVGINAFPDVLVSIKRSRKREFLDRLVRIYGPECFHKMCFVETEYLQNKMNIGLNSLTKAMNVLAGEQLLEFDIITDQPVARLVEARSGRFPFSKKQLESHRNTLFAKLELMNGYVQTTGCRSAYMRMYFGETGVPPECGFCDVCIGKGQGKADIFTEDNMKAICGFLEKGPMDFNEISRLSRISAGNLKPILSWLSRENKIRSDISGTGMTYRIKK